MNESLNTRFNCWWRTLSNLCLVLTLLASGHAVAQQSPQAEKSPQAESASASESDEPTTTVGQTPQAQAETNADSNKNNKTDNNTAGNQKPTGTVFNPTEEISEDSPVPFPVDI